jgi:hypothetical protein
VVHYRQRRYAEAETEFLTAAEAAEALYGVDHYEAQAARKHAQMARQQLEGNP